MDAKTSHTGSPPDVVSSAAEQPRRILDNEDRELLDLVSAVFTDPGVEAEVRMRIHEEIEDLLRTAHEDVYVAAVREVRSAPSHELPGAAPQEHDADLARLLEAMLVDPTLHTDTRMRLYHQIPALVQSAEDQPELAR